MTAPVFTPALVITRFTLAGKPWRTALMVGAVAIAASLVMTIACAMATVQASTEHGIIKFIGATDARIIHQGNGRFDDAWLQRARAWPQVHVATGRLFGSVTLVRADGKEDEKTGEPLRLTPQALGVDFALEGQFRIRELSAGAYPASPDEILIDPATAEKLHARVGDVLEVQRFGDPIPLKVAGIFQRPKLAAVQRPLIEMDRQALGAAADRQGDLTSIVIILKEGVNVAEFCARHQSELPEILALEPAELVRSGYDRQIVASRLGFIIASILTFISASFIIVTALTTSVTERQREMAVTRCIGASRPQLFISQIAAGLMIAVCGAIIGIPLGIGLTALLATYFAEYLPAGLRIHPLGIQLASIGSLAAGLIGAAYPAWMASRVSPLQAMSFRARPPRLETIALCTAAGLSLIGVQLALFQIPDTSARFLTYAYIGLPCLLLGYFILSIPLLVIVVNALSRPLSIGLRAPADMLGRSMLATPFRHGFTAGALMVGMAFLVSSWSNMTSLLHDWLGNIKFADAFVHKLSGITPQQQRAIAQLPFVTDVCTISYLPLRLYDRHVFGVEGLAPPNLTCFGFEPDKFFSMNKVEWVDAIAGGPPAAIETLKEGAGVIVADRFLATQKVRIGDTLKLGVGRVTKEFIIVGAVSSAGLDIATQSFGIRSQYMEYSVSCVFMDFHTVQRTFDNQDAHLMQLNLVPDVDDEQAIEEVARVAPGVQFHSGRWIVKTINDVATAILAVQSTVAFAALVLACLGVGNVILANIHARRYEYGVLRAVGGHRRLLAKLILSEAALIAVTGALVGTLLGLHLAWVGANNYRDMLGLPVRLVFPQAPTAIGWLVVLALTLLAALPGVWSVVRRQPSALLAAGRNG
jgi:putative ABC transport system permease protein